MDYLLSDDVIHRTYAGVLGKIIGVYLGRPFEGWTYRNILKELGEITYYIHERFNDPLVVTDDDISGTFTFLRALQDNDYSPNLTAEQIGQTWLNYIIENRTILWWGGLGMSTEHTAYLRLKHGISAPESGSIARNGQVVAEQIGGQIFIDGWGLICPGEPDKAASFAQKAASVSHDGVAIHCGQIVASMVAQAFVESKIDPLIDTALGFIPADSLIRTMIDDIRNWHAQGLDWRRGFEQIEARYGYDKFGGNCHAVPNHAIIIHSLLHAGDDFHRAMTIANTCGWDTDCNSGNVGCIMGVRLGMPGFDGGPDWRGPVADRMFLPTADGGRCISDAVTETYNVLNTSRRLSGLEPLSPKDGMKYHFSLNGSVQGFTSELGVLLNKDQTLQLTWHQAGQPIYASTEIFRACPPSRIGSYDLLASPALQPGQTIRAEFIGDAPESVEVAIVLGVYDAQDQVQWVTGPSTNLKKDDREVLEWTVPDLNGYPIAQVGFRATSAGPGSIRMDRLGWSGTPQVTFRQTEGSTWKQQWINGMSDHAGWGEPFRVVQNEGTGLLMTGCREWGDYRVSTQLVPHLVESCGLAARVQGMKRYYALEVIRGGGARLVKALDGINVLAEIPFEWNLGDAIDLELTVQGNHLVGTLNKNIKLEFEDTQRPLTGGGIALVLTEGRMGTHEIQIAPI